MNLIIVVLVEENCSTQAYYNEAYASMSKES